MNTTALGLIGHEAELVFVSRNSSEWWGCNLGLFANEKHLHPPSDWQRCHVAWAQNAEGTDTRLVMSQPLLVGLCPIYGLQVQHSCSVVSDAHTWDCFCDSHLPPCNMDTVASVYQAVRK